MSVAQVIRAWTDPVYRASLSVSDLASLPANPAGLIELSGTDLDQIAGGGGGCGNSGSKKSKKSHKSNKSHKSKNHTAHCGCSCCW